MRIDSSILGQDAVTILCAIGKESPPKGRRIHTYLAAVARLACSLRIGKLALHGGREVGTRSARGCTGRLRRAASMLNALDLDGKLRFVL